MDSPWLLAFRYHRWANLHLLDVCARLSDEQLQLTSAGTYGTIAATMLHLIGAEQGYVQRLGGSQRRFTRETAFPGIAALRHESERTTDELIEIATKTGPSDTLEIDREGARYRMPKGIVLVQALHHGNDHRTHVCTILGAHGIEYGDMDVWAFSHATGHENAVEKGG